MSLTIDNQLLSRFVLVYQSLNADNLHLLDEVYDEQITFIDPLHRIDGLNDLRSYMQGMYQNLSDYGIQIEDCVESGDTAFLQWNMYFSHPRLRGGKRIEFMGATKLAFDDKITYHRDFFDAGAMLYQHIPLLGSVIKMINKRAGI